MNNFALIAGAAQVDVTPTKPLFLYGYPHVPRISMGTADPLHASALCLESGGQTFLFIAVDVILISKALTAAVRTRLSKTTGIPPANILLSATHTHSGPVTVAYLSNECDLVVAPPDADYLRALEDGIVAAGTAAWQLRRPAEFAIVHADATGIGSCRHAPDGPRDLSVPVLAVREAASNTFIAVMLVCAMHPTVLHEDFKQYSGDFPAYAAKYLQQHVIGANCPVVYHTGAAGNQSPRHVTKGNTLAEAIRLGEILGAAVERALAGATFTTEARLAGAQRFVDLPAREALPVEEAKARARFARTRLNGLQGAGVSPAERRTAECDWFGAEESVSIALAAEQGRLLPTLKSILPAEIQVITVNDHAFVAWPGEFFVEFALRLKQKHRDVSVITLANGELQGYVVTREAIDHSWYESGNALLKSPDAGDRMVEATDKLLTSLRETTHA